MIISFIAANYSIVDEVEPSRVLLQPDLLIGNFDNMLRGFLETPGRAVQPSYNSLVAIQINQLSTTMIFEHFNYTFRLQISCLKYQTWTDTLVLI